MTKTPETVHNIVIVTAKGGNTTVENKNAIPIYGIPVMCYPLRAARLAQHVDVVLLSTEDDRLKRMGLKEGAEILDRPRELAEPTSLHKDVIAHAVQEAEARYPNLENVVVLLGNTVMVTPGIIDKALEMLKADDCDSVATAWKAQDDHPYRALCVNDRGYLESFMKVDVGSNRQSYPDVYYYDQGVWAFRKDCAYRQEGPSPWVWLGKQCKMLERLWVTGRDIHSWIDISASAWYLSSIQVNDYIGYRDEG